MNILVALLALTQWQWSIPDGDARAYLWIPPHCERVRAVVVANHNMIEQGILERPAMRAELDKLGIAEVWVVPAMDATFDFHQGAGEHFERIMTALADESGYGELRFAPVIPVGHSACATYPWNFAAWNPARTLAVLSVHGDAPQTTLTGNGKPRIEWGDRAIAGIPGLMVMGEYEWSEDRIAPALDFEKKHPGVPLAFLADAGHGHYDYSDEMVSFLAMFIRKAAAARLPADAPLDAPVPLKPVNPETGWRVDRWRKDEPPLAPAAPFRDYAGAGLSAAGVELKAAGAEPAAAGAGQKPAGGEPAAAGAKPAAAGAEPEAAGGEPAAAEPKLAVAGGKQKASGAERAVAEAELAASKTERHVAQAGSFWCFDEEMARATEHIYAASRGKKPQLLSVTSPGEPVEKGCGEPVSPKWQPLDDGMTFKLATAFMDHVPGDAKNTNPARWAALPVGTPLGHATGGGPIKLSRTVGPAVQTGADTFTLRFGRAEYTPNRRNTDIWIVATHPGDADFKPAVQQACVHVLPNTGGTAQRITFPPIENQTAGVATLKLNATSDAGLPVQYYVREGPAEIDGDTLRFTAIPPRAKFPVKVTVVAWQWGRATAPTINTAEPVERTFEIAAAAGAAGRLPAEAQPRQQIPLAGPGWKFLGAGEEASLPEIGSPAFQEAAWSEVSVPHNFQTRAAYDTLSKGCYRREIEVGPALAGKQLYLVFEGAAAIADVYVNGRHLGQHRGAYTRFVFDATAALHAGRDNELAVFVDDSAAATADCLPNATGLYKVWGGLYRKVWLVAAAPVHIDPTDHAAPGVYLTPHDVGESSAGLSLRVLLRNASSRPARADIHARILDPVGAEVRALDGSADLEAEGRGAVELSTTIAKPQLWELGKGGLYTVETGVTVGGKLVDEVTETTGFRTVRWDWKEGKVEVNGHRVLLAGANLHQETEAKGSAVSDDDLRHNFDFIRDLGFNFLRLPHYPHARLEYDLCDESGILCWAENGNSNGRWVKKGDLASPTAASITTEMVKQNYNHPSIALWSVGNEAAPEPADQCVPVVKALDPTRPVVVANMKQGLADFKTENIYPGWYGGGALDSYQPRGFISEIGAGGVVTTHCDYARATWKVNSYEPEEYQQLVAENHFQQSFHGDNSRLGLFLWWCLRDFSDVKYKKPVGVNTKGLLTYAGDKKDVYYLWRSFLRPQEPTVHITSQRYFLRMGAVDNGIKAYSNAPRLTLTLNGEAVSALENGQYRQPQNGHRADNVFYWPVPLRTGKNVAVVADEAGHTDTATIYFYGAGGLPETSAGALPIAALQLSNPKNPAYFMDMPVQAQWPIYYDLDSTADNSFDTLPTQIEGARWIATRRVTKPGLATALSFRLTRSGTVFIMAAKRPDAPAFVKSAGFQEVTTPALQWRNPDLILAAAQLFSRHGAAGEVIQLPEADRDQIVLVKE